MIDEGTFQIPSVSGSFRPGGKAAASQSSVRVCRSGRSPAALASGGRLKLDKTDRQDFKAVIPALEPPGRQRNLDILAQRCQRDHDLSNSNALKSLICYRRRVNEAPPQISSNQSLNWRVLLFEECAVWF